MKGLSSYLPLNFSLAAGDKAGFWSESQVFRKKWGLVSEGTETGLRELQAFCHITDVCLN